MTTLAEKLAASRASIETHEPEVGKLPDAEESIIPAKEEPLIPAEETVVTDDRNEIMEYRKTKLDETKVVAFQKSEFISPNNSLRGYQWACGILRPNLKTGVYVATNEAEETLCQSLVDDGLLIKKTK